MSNWQLAWDRYALAAQVTGQLSFAGAMKHKLVVCEIAANAVAEGRMPLLGVLFDEEARKEWEDLSGKLGAAFDIEAAIGARTEELLRKARVLHDSLMNRRVASPVRFDKVARCVGLF